MNERGDKGNESSAGTIMVKAHRFESLQRGELFPEIP